MAFPPIGGATLECRKGEKGGGGNGSKLGWLSGKRLLTSSPSRRYSRPRGVWFCTTTAPHAHCCGAAVTTPALAAATDPLTCCAAGVQKEEMAFCTEHIVERGKGLLSLCATTPPSLHSHFYTALKKKFSGGGGLSDRELTLLQTLFGYFPPPWTEVKAPL